MELELHYALIATIGAKDFSLPESYLEELGRDWHYRLGNLLDTKDYTYLVGHVKELLNSQIGARHWGKKALEDPQLKPNLKNFPIFSPILSVSDPVTGLTLDNCLSQIWLIATNKNDDRDSIYYARLIEKYLGKLVPNLANCPVEIIELKEAQANRYDEVFWELEPKFSATEMKARLAEFERIYLAFSGGTPAMSWATLQAIARLCGDKLFTVYTEETS